MIDDMAVYIANLGKYNEGYLVGAWFTYPIDEEVPEYYFSNPDPYAKVEPRPDDAPSVSLLSMKRATSSSRICLPFGCPM